jgi:hypothetical protein
LEGAEIAQLINELETRVERLRALYDQYFVGIERLEPLVLRKDVDRRLWMLRREQIRNTALRFKLETTVQRYNTYQQYWQRIVREIENGTYQRDLGRAMRRFGDASLTAFGKRRQKMFEKGQARRAEREADRLGRSSAPPPLDSKAPPPGGSNPPSNAPVSNGALPRVPSPPPPSSLPSTHASEDWDVDLDLELQSSRPPPPAPVAAATQAKATPAIPSPRPPPGFPASPPIHTPPSAASPAQARASLPTAASPTRDRAPAPAALAGRPARSPAATVTSAAQPGAVPVPKANPPAPTAGKPAAAAVKPEPARPVHADADLSAARMRQIYGQYVEAKRRANESTATITYEKVAANLRQTAQALRAKHGSQSVDFEVVLKNGKAALKPILKG